MVLPLGFLILLTVPIVGVLALVTGSSKATGLGLVIALCLAGTGAGLTLTQRVLRRSRAAVVIAAAVLTGLAFAGPMFGWTVGHPQEREPAVDLGLILAAACLAVVVAAGWWAGRDPIQQPDPAIRL